VNLKKLVAKALVWTALESFTLSGLSLLSLFVFARLLSREDFGVVAIALAIVQLLNVPVDMLFHDALVQRKDLQSIDVDSAFTFTVVLGALLCGACWLGAGVLESLLDAPGLTGVLQWMSLSLLGSAFGAVVIAMQRRKLEFRALAIRSLIGRAGSAVIAISMAFYGFGVWSLVAQQVLLVCLGTLMLWILADERPHFRFSWLPTKGLLGFGVFTAVSTLLSLAIPRVFMVMVGGYLGTASAGLLSLAFRGLDMLRDLVSQAVSQVALPLFSRLSDERETLFDAYNRAVQLTTFVTYPVFTGLAICADDVVTIAFGKQWLAAAPYFAVISLLVLQYFLRLYSSRLMRAVGKPGAPMYELVAQTVTAALAMVLFGRYSVTLAMVAWSCRLIVSVPLDMWIMRRASGMSYARQLRGAGTPFVAAAVMACATLSVKEYLLDSLPPLMRVFPLAVVGIAAYTATFALVNREVLRDIVNLVTQSLPSRS
jgi:O-antigen/teichoic acid export membrane protein